MNYTAAQLLEFHQEYILSRLDIENQGKLRRGIQHMLKTRTFPVDFAARRMPDGYVEAVNKLMQQPAHGRTASGLQRQILSYVNSWTQHAKTPWRFTLYDISGQYDRPAYRTDAEDMAHSINVRLVYWPGFVDNRNFAPRLALNLDKVDYANPGKQGLPKLGMDVYFTADRSLRHVCEVAQDTSLLKHLYEIYSRDTLLQMPTQVRTNFRRLLNYAMSLK